MNLISSSEVFRISSIRLGTIPYPIASEIYPLVPHFAAASIISALATSLLSPIT